MSNTQELEIFTETIDDAVIVRPVGEIDLSGAPALRQQLKQAQETRPGRVIVDLGEVPYMDSSGLATLVEAMQIARKNQGKLIICALQQKVRSIFEIARLDMVFKIVNTRDEALAL
ncbi:MAG: STAS domain-containing protein [Planctomycetes bacterium]|nr:STAS domain-containing protein [Planctomycetota bacterium]